MSKILVSGLINIETSAKIEQFPINYSPIHYAFFGVNTAVSGVAYNIAKALKTLGDDVELITMTGNDFPSEYIKREIASVGISSAYIKSTLTQTPNTVVLYDENGKRQIYCDLKDIQEAKYDFKIEQYQDKDIVVACNTNFNRDLLVKAKKLGKIIATDVHVIDNIHDEYNKDFMMHADILFLSDERIPTDPKKFIYELARTYHNQIIVVGLGAKGSMMYLNQDDKIYEMPSVQVRKVINTVGAGDALFSSFLHFYAKGNTALEALEKATIFASYKIGSDGASNGFASETFINEYYNKKRKDLL